MELPDFSGKGIGHLLMHVKNEYPTIQINGWKLWPAAAMFNYRYIPLNLRVLFLNLVALGWCVSLSLCKILACVASVGPGSRQMQFLCMVHNG